MGRLTDVQTRLQEASDLAQAAGKVLEGQPARMLDVLTPVEVANVFHDKERR